MPEIHFPGHELDGGPNPNNPEEYCRVCQFYFFKGFQWMSSGEAMAISLAPPGDEKTDYWRKDYCRLTPDFSITYKNNWCGKWEKKTT